MEHSSELQILQLACDNGVFSAHVCFVQSKWRAQCHGVGYDFEGGRASLLDLRFADDIFTIPSLAQS